MLKSRFVEWVCSVVMVMGASVVCGQDYPNRPIRIVTTGAGGGNDFAARVIAQGLTGPLGQSVIVDNRAGSITSMTVVSKAPADGYTLLFSGSVLWILPFLRDTPYDPVKDFSPITLVTKEPSVIVVHPSLPVKSVKELIALTKSRPGGLNYGSSGTGTSAHLAAELFKVTADANIRHIPYKNSGEAITALIGGEEVQVMIGAAGTMWPHVKSGKLKALAVASAEPSALVPGLPIVAASGLPGYEWVGLGAIWAPAKTPAAIINRLNQAIAGA